MVRATVTFCCLFATTSGLASIPAIHISAKLLDDVDVVVREIQANADSLDIQSLGISYKDGKDLEQWIAITKKHTAVALDAASKIRRADTISLPVVLLVELLTIRDSIKALGDALARAGEHSNASRAILAAMPLSEFEKRLLEPTNALDDRVLAISALADTAVAKCSTR